MRMATLFAAAHPRCFRRNAECMYGSSPDDGARSQHPPHRTVIVAPGLPISSAARSWPIPALGASGAAFGGYGTALTAASPISSGKGRSTPAALALPPTFLTVVSERLHENDMLRTLTPMARSLGISRYLAICFPFPSRPRRLLRLMWIVGRKTPLAGRRIGTYQLLAESRTGRLWKAGPIRP